MNHLDELKALDSARWRIAVWLTVAMMVVYFTFILLVAYDKPLLTQVVVPGLSLGCSSGFTSAGPISTTTRRSRR
jgi:uncharacterized membrane protein (DUF485 family)